LTLASGDCFAVEFDLADTGSEASGFDARSGSTLVSSESGLEEFVVLACPLSFRGDDDRSELQPNNKGKIKNVVRAFHPVHFESTNRPFHGRGRWSS